MKTDYGTIKAYFPNKQIGYIEHTLKNGYQGDIFFHITTIRNGNPELARKIERQFNEPKSFNKLFKAMKSEQHTPIRFWFEYENAPKGKRLCNVRNADFVRKKITSPSNLIVGKIEARWANIPHTLPDWIEQVTIDILGRDRAAELSAAREGTKAEQQKGEPRRIQRQAVIQTNRSTRHRPFVLPNDQEHLEEQEYSRLITKMRPLGYSSSSEVSRYIRRNRLGDKYPNISGMLEIEASEESWVFDGGISPRYYARLCNDLGLGNEGSGARARRFTSYRSLRL